jgi:hypothetical protein
MQGVLAFLTGPASYAEQLARLVEGLAGRLEPGGWPLWAVTALAGGVLLLQGLKLHRLVNALGGALVGAWWGAQFAGLVPGWMPPWFPGWGLAMALGAASLLFDDVYPIALGVTPGVLMGLRIPLDGQAWIGGLAGAIVTALAALALRRQVIALSASIGGASLVAAAALAAARQVSSLALLAQRPTLLVAAAGVLAVAGTAFQLGRSAGSAPERPPPAEPAEPGLDDEHWEEPS